MKKLLILFVAILSLPDLNAQVLKIGTMQSCGFLKNTIITDTLCLYSKTLLTSDAAMAARDSIIFKAGFSVGPDDLQGHVFTAKIDHSLVSQVNDYQQSMVNGTIPGLNTSDCVPGSIGGSIDVSANGAATYQIPLQVSPGSNGMQPNLSIVYDSRSGNGLLGYGWNLSGISSISRVNKTMYFNGTFDPISLSNSDAFALDGDVLIANGSDMYYPSKNPYVKVVYSNDAFTVTTQNGTIIEYGKEGNSLAYSSGSNIPIAYYISRITDSNGNYILFVYSGNNIQSDHHISEIKYTGNGSIEPYNSIKFFYDQKSDVSNSFIGGNSIIHNSLLTAIKVICDGNISKEYNFSYFFDTYSKLRSISLTADGMKFNPTIINWNSIPIGKNVQQGTLGTSNLKYYFGDFNGDGKVERAIHTPNGTGAISKTITVDGLGWFSVPGDSYYQVQNSFFSEKYTVKDINITDWNSDGKDEILVHYIHYIMEEQTDANTDLCTDWYTEYDDVVAYTYNQGSFSSANISEYVSQARILYANKSPYTFTYSYADFNNDGIVERLVFRNKTFYKADRLTLAPSPSFGTVDDFRLLDFNGNSKIDFLALTNDGMGSIWEYNGTTFNNLLGSGTRTKIGDNTNCIMPGDLNGDGKTDILSLVSSEWVANISTGIAFSQVKLPVDFNYMSILALDDVNNDGIADLIGTLNGLVKVYINNGQSFYLQSEIDIRSFYSTYGSGYNSKITFYPIDLDNDGQKELVYTCDYYRVVSGVIDYFPYITLKFENRLDLPMYVSSITDGYGNTSTITYSPYINTKLFSVSFPKPNLPLVLFRGPTLLVSSIKTTSEGNVLSNTKYSFDYGYSNTQGLGFLGFKSVVSYDSISGVSTSSSYELTLPNAEGIYMPWLHRQVVVRKNNPILTNTYSMEARKLNLPQKSCIPVIITAISKDEIKNVSSITTNVFDESVGRVTLQSVNVGSWIKSTSTSYGTVLGYVTRPLQITTTQSHGGDTHTSTITYGYGSGLSMQPSSKTENGITTTYTGFDGYGNLLSVVTSTSDGLSRRSSCVYDEHGRFIVSKTDIYGNTVNFGYRNSNGAMLWETDPIGNKTEYSYLAQGGALVTTAKLPDGNISTTALGWDNSPGHYKLEQTVTNGNAVTTHYNAAAQKLSESSWGFLKSMVTTSYTYYADGSLESEQKTGYNPINYTYHDNGLLESITGLNLNNTYKYIDREVTENNLVAGTRQTKTYDELGNVTLVQTSDGGEDIKYSYWASGKVSQIEVGGKVTSMTYDQQGNQLTLNDPSTGLTSYTYNGFGQLLTQKDALDQLTSCTYDGSTGLLTQKSAPGITEAYTYYTSIGMKGMMQSATRNGISETYAYDNLLRPITITTTGFGKTYVSRNEYNSQGRLGHFTYPSGLKVEYEYDDVGNLLKIWDDSNKSKPIWEGVSKNPQQQWTQFNKGGLLVTRWNWDSNHMLCSIKTGTSSNATGIQNLGFTFNSNGQLTGRTDGALNETFSYDKLNRLTSDLQAGKLPSSYQYQPNGNVGSTSLAGAYNYTEGKPYAVSTVSGSSSQGANPTYTTNSTYTVENMVADMDNGVSQNVFHYGPSGNRFKVDFKQGNVLVTSKIYVGNCEFLLNDAGNVTASRTFIYAPTGIVAVYEVPGTNAGAYHYIHTDYLGSWLAITDSIGNVENRYSYDAWGRPRNPDTWQLLPISVTSALVNLNAMQPRFDRGYTGHELMAGFGLINMNGRLYDPYLQRFLSADPYVQYPENPQSYNRYTYCLNNPLMYTDPTGHYSSLWYHTPHIYKSSDGRGGIYTNIENTFVDREGTLYRWNYGRLEVLEYYDFYLNGVQDADHYMFTKSKWAPAASMLVLDDPQSTGGDGIWNKIKDFVGEDFWDSKVPVAFSYSVNLGLNPVGGGNYTPWGYLFVLKGKDEFKGKHFTDIGIGLGWDLSATIVKTEYFFTGDVNNLTIDNFKGLRHSFNVSFANPWGVEVSYAVSVAKVGNSYLIGISGGLGAGVPGFGGGINGGYTNFY